MATSGDKAGRSRLSRISAGAASFRQIVARPARPRHHALPASPLAASPLAASPLAASPLAAASATPVSLAQDAEITAILEGDILPRLMMAHCAAPSALEGEHARGLAPDYARAFAELPLRLEAPDLLAEVERFLAAGLGVEALYVDVLAPAARHLGEMWERDECDFVDVTMGLWRLQEVMRDVAARSPSITAPLDQRRSALFAPMPGDDHSFGAQMIDEVFAQAGWSSTVMVNTQRRELLDHIAHRATDLVGLTVSRDCPNSALASLVRAIRSVSLNPNVRILIGGHVINQNPGIVAKVGADGTGVDAKAALELAERLILIAPLRAPTLT